MTQETLDMVVHAYCEGCQEFIGDYELKVTDLESMPITYQVYVYHKDIDNIVLPFSYIRKVHLPKSKSEIIIELVKQVIENGDQWLQSDLDYYGDKLAENGDNDYKSRLEND